MKYRTGAIPMTDAQLMRMLAALCIYPHDEACQKAVDALYCLAAVIDPPRVTNVDHEPPWEEPDPDRKHDAERNGDVPSRMDRLSDEEYHRQMDDEP